MQILIIDNTIDPVSWGSSELCAMARLAPGATIRVRRAPHDDLPLSPQGFDRIIVSGSRTAALEEAPWIERLDDFLRRSVNENKPIFGICYGHQSLARALGSRENVRRADRGEFGWGRIELTSEGRQSPLMRQLPAQFHSFQWHNDEVSKLPVEFKLLARSEHCPIQAFQVENRPVYGVQFHPERALEAGERSLSRKYAEDPRAPFLNRRLGSKLFDASVGTTLFKNFLALETE